MDDKEWEALFDTYITEVVDDEQEHIKSHMLPTAIKIRSLVGDSVTQAAANKAAEEGGLPTPRAIMDVVDEFGSGTTCYIAEDLRAAIAFAIAADRASRQVANKAEVEEELRDYWMDKGFLQWVHDRLRFVHKENENVDYMHKLRSIIASFPDDRKTPNVDSIATPPATTGASTAPAETFIKLRNRVAELEKQIREQSVGASTVLTDERIERDFLNHWDSVSYDYGVNREFDTAYIAARAAWFAREVAAQAGQVAVPDDVAFDAARWRFMMRVADDADGLEAQAVESLGNEQMETERPESEQMCELVDQAIAKVAAPSPAKESK